MQGGPGIHTLVDDYLAAHDLPTSLRGSYIGSVERLRQEDVDIHLTGHPGQSKMRKRKDLLDEGDALAFVDSDRWSRYLDHLEENFYEQFST